MCEAILTIFYLITVWRTHCLESGKVLAHPMHSNTGLGGRLQALLLRLWREHRLLGAVCTDGLGHFLCSDCSVFAALQRLVYGVVSPSSGHHAALLE